jgi:hypothetical protein
LALVALVKKPLGTEQSILDRITPPISISARLDSGTCKSIVLNGEPFLTAKKSSSVLEHMTKGKPILLNKNNESFDRPVVGIE